GPASDLPSRSPGRAGQPGVRLLGPSHFRLPAPAHPLTAGWDNGADLPPWHRRPGDAAAVWSMGLLLAAGAGRADLPGGPQRAGADRRAAGELQGSQRSAVSDQRSAKAENQELTADC